MALSLKQRRFALEYFKDGNGTRAAIRAGYSPDGANVAASRLLTNDIVISVIAEHEADAAAAAGLTRARVLREMMDIAFADPADLVRVQVRACSQCWPAPLQLSEPNPVCEQCSGIGSQRSVWLADTASVPAASRKLFLGAKQTKEGIDVKLRDQTPILMALAKVVGLLQEKTELSGPGGGPIQLQAVKRAEEFSDDELALLMAGTPEGSK
jgi:hypothetical protein